MVYADKEYYQREYAGIVVPEQELEKALK